jgi:hypothetical protein
VDRDGSGPRVQRLGDVIAQLRPLAPAGDNGAGAKTSFRWRWREAVMKSELPPLTTLVAYALAMHMDDDGGSCFPSVVRLAEETRLAESTVREQLRLLERRGFIRTARGGGRGRANEFQALIPEPGQIGRVVTKPTAARRVSNPPPGAGNPPPHGLNPPPRGPQSERDRQENDTRARSEPNGSPPSRAPSPARIQYLRRWITALEAKPRPTPLQREALEEHRRELEGADR